MRFGGAAGILLVVSLVFVMVSSCAKLRPRPITTPAPAPAERKRETVRKKEASLKSRVEVLFEHGKYEEVVSLVEKEKVPLKKGSYFRKAFVKALAGMREEAISSFSRGEYKKAGLLLVEILNAVDGKKSLAAEAGVSEKEVRENVEACARKLMEEGLAQYREGNLGFAIKKWSEILVFLPDYSEAKKAIGVATVQLKNLRKLESGGK